MNYEQDMYIDEDALDIEALEQPQLMIRYSTQLSEAKRERDIAKEAVEYTSSQIEKSIRDDPEKFALEKITESAIRGAIVRESRYQDVLKEYHEAKYQADLLQGVVSAIEQRKNMIEALIKLHGQQYFAGPRIPHDLTDLRKQKQKEIKEKIGKKLTRKK